MITINGEPDLQIRWNGKDWRDKAGHVFEMRSHPVTRQAMLVSKEHGTYYDSQWSIPKAGGADE